MCQRLSFIAMILFLALVLHAEVPNEVSYNGRLTEKGYAVNGTRTVKFSFWNAETGGSMVGTEITRSCNVINGVFSAILNPDIDLRNKDYWIQVVVGSSILDPRQKITAQVYALHSRTAEDIEKSTGPIHFLLGTSTQAAISYNGLNVLSGKVMEEGNAILPRGIIVMWSGAISAVPAGWVLCDGSNGTPDLRDRFIVGAGSSYSPANIGGANTVTLTTDQLPSHTHSLSINPDGSL